MIYFAHMSVATTWTRTMDALECKAKFFHVRDEVASTRKGVVVTRDGKPVAEIVPFEGKAESTDSMTRPKSIVGALRGSVTIIGDLDEPTGGDWEVLKE
jgi:antitoxin (DNA-binding transcriptional repressor) of toxin-antitoxin stability system